MFPRFLTLRRCTSLLLLAVYGPVGLLGYGLHDLLHAHHLCHVAKAEVSGCCSGHLDPNHLDPNHLDPSAENDPCCFAGELHTCCAHGTAHGAKPTSAPTGPFASAVEHDCAICQLLAQAQQPSLTLAESQISTAVPAGQPVDEIRAPLYLPEGHLARGPPHC